MYNFTLRHDDIITQYNVQQLEHIIYSAIHNAGMVYMKYKPCLFKSASRTPPGLAPPVDYHANVDRQGQHHGNHKTEDNDSALPNFASFESFEGLLTESWNVI